MSLGERLKELRKQRRLTQQELAQQIGCSHQTISKYEKDENMEKIKVISSLSDFFGVSTDQLIKGTVSQNIGEISVDEEKFISKYRCLSHHDKEIVDHIFNMQPEEPSKIYRFPVFYQSAAAGIGKLSETEDYQMEEFELKTIPKKAVFGMFIKGHSMETILYENDIVLIDPSEKEPNSLDDEIVVARFGDELICKRLTINEDNQTYDFNSENPNDKDKGRYNQEQSNFTLVGKVVKIIHAHETGFGNITYSED